MVPSFLWLRTRPGPPLQDLYGSNKQGLIRQITWTVLFAWKRLWRTILFAVQLRQMLIFLIAWFMISDAQASVSGTAVLFARTELKLGTIGVAMLSITVMISGIVGSSLFPLISRWLHWDSNRTVVSCLVLMEFIPLYGLLGYLPFVQKWGVGGLQVWWEIYICAVVFGAAMGGLSSYCRSLFGSLIPPGREAAFFALYAITDKGSSAIGPAVIGRIVDATGHIRPAFWFLAVLIAIPIPLVWNVNVAEGQDDASRMAGKLDAELRLTYQMRQIGSEAEEEGLMARRDTE